ncbi:hypothetical protein [uncultured Psychroserpens sp.]|uniref:hypothetical protein n=1 Tax=uncultured Psychroserpens sp. TaxID=255436 RepID=UPI00261FC098|nr:hypothetical protein [uncultured Psychroserpens sp.]
MKKLLTIVSLLAFIFLMLYGALHLFGRQIYNTKSCELYNIDNIELRTGVDIPKVKSTDCECKDNTKVSKFIIDTNQLDLDRYISRNDFELKDSIYVKENDNDNSTYRVTFNKKTAELIVNLTYKND